MKYMCVCAGHFLPVGGLPREYDSPSVCRESSSAYDISSMSLHTKLEERPLVNSVPLQHMSREQRSSDNHTNNNQSARRKESYLQQFEPLPTSDLDIVASMNQLRKSMKQIESFFVTKEREARRQRKIRREWKSVAIVMDRVFFVLYLAIIATSITLMFPRP